VRTPPKPPFASNGFEPHTSTEMKTRQTHDIFVTTRWSLVASAGRKSSPDATKALEELCQAYWFPLYAFVRRRVGSKEDAEDLTQAFFESLLSQNLFAGLEQERGKFRAYLLAALKNFLSNAKDKQRRLKRGGGQTILSLNWEEADTRYQLDARDPVDPYRSFDREWALTLLEQTVLRLGDEYAATGRDSFFKASKTALSVSQDKIDHAHIARTCGMEEGAVRVAVHRLRKRYRSLLRTVVAETLAHPEQVDEELKSLKQALRS
jgi:RNA polymerase sigma factor (sigma-70 family)